MSAIWSVCVELSCVVSVFLLIHFADCRWKIGEEEKKKKERRREDAPCLIKKTVNDRFYVSEGIVSNDLRSLILVADHISITFFCE